MFSASTGAAARFAGPEGADCPSLDDQDVLVLQALQGLAVNVRPRDISVWSAPRPCVLIYMDGSTPEVGDPHGGTCRVPHEVVASWKPRAQQIFPRSAVKIGSEFWIVTRLWWQR